MTVINHEYLTARMDKLCVGPRVRERVLRLNPNPKEGIMLRGWHRKKTLNNLRCMEDLVGRDDILRHYGKERGTLVWRQIKRTTCMSGHGKRKRFSRAMLLDNLLTEKQA